MPLHPASEMYPTLNNSEQQSTGQSFRLEHIRKIQSDLESEMNNYMKCRRRYATLYKWFTYGTHATGGVSVALTSTSMAMFASGVGVITGSVGLGAAGAAFVLSFVNKSVAKKLKKHDTLVALANSKLCDVRELISKAIDDNKISDEEFRHIQDVFRNYKQEKLDIQKKSRLALADPVSAEELKKKFIEQGRKMERKEIGDRLKIESTLGQ